MKRCVKWLWRSLREIVHDSRGSQVMQFLTCMALVILIATGIAEASNGSLGKQLDQIIQNKNDENNHNIQKMIENPTNVNVHKGEGTSGSNSGRPTSNFIPLPTTSASSTGQAHQGSGIDSSTGSGNWFTHALNSIGNGFKDTWNVTTAATKKALHAVQSGTSTVESWADDAWKWTVAHKDGIEAGLTAAAGVGLLFVPGAQEFGVMILGGMLLGGGISALSGNNLHTIMQDATIGGITGVIGGAVGKFALQGLMRVGAAPAVARGLSKVVQVGRRIFGSGDTTGESRLQVTVAKWFTRSTAWGSGSTTSSIGDDVLHHRSINWKKASAAALLSLALGTAGVAIGSNKDKMINSINNTPIEFALHQTEGGPFPLPTTRIGDTKVGQYLQKFASKGSSETAVKDPAVAEGMGKVQNALPNLENAKIDPRKLTDYALNPEHPVGGNKAKVFESALGYNKSNADELMKQVQEKLPQSEAILGKADQYGQRYTVDMQITGPNGNTTTVRTGWIIKPGSDVPEMTTIYVK